MYNCEDGSKSNRCCFISFPIPSDDGGPIHRILRILHIRRPLNYFNNVSENSKKGQMLREFYLASVIFISMCELMNNLIFTGYFKTILQLR